MILTPHKIALRYLEAEWHRSAKPLYLRALDFTAGLIRKFDSRGQAVSSEASNKVLLRRILQMRSMVQDGFDLGSLVRNKDILVGLGARVVSLSETQDRKEEMLLPQEEDLRNFLQEYPNRKHQAQTHQARFLQGLISRELGIEDLEKKVMEDRVVFNEAFSLVNAYVRGVKNPVSGLLSGSPGVFQIRDKSEQSTWDKSTKKMHVPFYYLGDLLGCRSVTTTIPDMARACSIVQDRLDIESKKNWYLTPSEGYNAVHYYLMVSEIVVEYQVKAVVNKLESALSHDLIYSDEKFRDRFKVEPLPAAEKDLVKRVIDISSSLSTSDLNSYFEGSVQKAPEDVLYGENLPPGELERRIHMARGKRDPIPHR